MLRSVDQIVRQGKLGKIRENPEIKTIRRDVMGGILTHKKGPLSGLKVLELAQYAAGPFAGLLLADLGADVVKIERPGGGDLLRGWSPLLENADGEAFSASFAALNRNKRSFSLDFGDADSRETLYALVRSADVFLENFRPGVLKKYGLGYEDLKRINPKLVYCSVTGYGQTGPYAKRGAFDVTIQAASGLMSVTGEDGGGPVKAGVPVADFAAALYAGFSILAAVRQADQTGVGAHVDCPMLGCSLGISALQTSEFFATGHSPEKLGSRHPKNSPYQAFFGADKAFVVAAGNDKLWQAVCDSVGRPELVDDPRFLTVPDRARNQLDLGDLLQPIFSTKPAATWLQDLNARGVPCAPVNTVEDCLADEQTLHMGLVSDMMLPNGVTTKTVPFPVAISGFEAFVGDVPKLGEHSQKILEEWVGRNDKIDHGEAS